jgi:magnesium-transporting ATPase (P-type)
LLAQRVIDRQEYEAWNSDFEKAMQSVLNREENVAEVNERIEVKLELIGSTAIEDRLQDGVRKSTIYP